jgi:DNA-binding NtrC family response regulator
MGSRLGQEIGRVSIDAMKILLNYPYPGNVRQLKNIIEHAVILCQGEEISRQALPGYVFDLEKKCVPPSPVRPDSPDPSINPLLAKEREAILETLSAHGWNLQKTANALHINRTTLWRKMKKDGLSSKQRPYQ